MSEINKTLEGLEAPDIDIPMTSKTEGIVKYLQRAKDHNYGIAIIKMKDNIPDIQYTYSSGEKEGEKAIAPIDCVDGQGDYMTIRINGDCYTMNPDNIAYVMCNKLDK